MFLQFLGGTHGAEKVQAVGVLFQALGTKGGASLGPDDTALSFRVWALSIAYWPQEGMSGKPDH